MASSSIKGLTIEIGANTTKFTSAMKSLDAETRAISKDLKTVNENLKLDPKNISTAADKLKLLQDQAANAGKKVETIAAAVEKFKATRADTMSDDYKKSLANLEKQLESAKREQELANAQVEAFQQASDDAGKGALNLSNLIKGNLISSAIQKGLSVLVDLLKSAAQFAVNAVKKVGEYAKSAVSMAAEWEDALGYSEQVYADYSTTVQKWVEDNSLNLRIGETALIQYVNKFGALFRTFGFDAEQAAKNSEDLIKLAVDLRAATGDDIDQIIQSLTSGLTGGYKAFQRYGVVVNEARIQAEALALGLVQVEVNQLDVEKATLKVQEANKKAADALAKHGEESLEYQKAQIAIQEAEEALTKALGGKELALDDVAKKTAILSIVQGDLAFAEGQAAKEGDSYSSQLALRDTLLENLQKRIGEKLLPVFTEFITKVNEFMQSDAGKAVMDALAESVGILADKLMELLQDERLTTWVANLKDEVPKAAEKMVNFAEKIGELIPKIIDLTEKLLKLFGIKSEAEQAKEAFMQVSNKVEDMANMYDMSLETAQKAINEFAQVNGIDLSDIYENWDAYQPLILEFIGGIAGGTEDMEEKYNEHLSQLAPELQEAVNDISAVDLSPYDQRLAKMSQQAEENASRIKQHWEGLKTTFQGLINFFNDNEPRIIGDGEDWRDQLDWSWRNSEANGGPVRAGQLYRINDDAGRRTEMFIPSTNGYILNGNQTDKIINNSSSQNFSGGINIYVNSYGMNIAEVADELGAAFQNKIRMSGAMI